MCSCLFIVSLLIKNIVIKLSRSSGLFSKKKEEVHYSWRHSIEKAREIWWLPHISFQSFHINCQIVNLMTLGSFQLRLLKKILIREDKDSIGLQILHVLHLKLLLHIAMLFIGSRLVKYTSHPSWSGARSLLLLSSSPFIPLIFRLFHYSWSNSNASLRYHVDWSEFPINFVGTCAFCNAKKPILRGVGSDTLRVPGLPRQRCLDYDTHIEASRSLSRTIWSALTWQWMSLHISFPGQTTIVQQRDVRI